MKTKKLFVLAICCVLPSIMCAITLRGLPQYKITVMINNYTNPTQATPVIICTGFSCIMLSETKCCDGFNSGSFGCKRCDSFFTYCLRNVDTTTTGCPEGGNNIIMRSDVNQNDAPIDFSQNSVLGLDNPLIFQGLVNDTWNGVQLYIEIKDQDQDGSELIDIVRWNITQDVGVPSGIINVTGLNDLVTMEVNITVLCVPGFTGSMCEENIDDCVGVSCGENGQCVDGVNSFTCNCTTGFTGALCNETDECVNVTCSGRGQCVDGVASYVCDCDAGYTGENCEINIDDCLSNPCGERGQCVDGVNSFRCNCTSGFTGALCNETVTDECVNVTCSERGRCVDGVTSYMCECDAGYTGGNCEMNIDDCLSDPCGEGGRCVDEVNSFRCNCTSGFTGDLCNETVTDECVNVTCSGRGRCMNGVTSYMCHCDAGYTGENCEINIDDCLLNPCGEAGWCMDEVDSFICICNPAFTGELCQIIVDDCVGASCRINGEWNDIGPIVGGVLGIFVALTVILILVVVVVLSMRGWKRAEKDVQGRPSYRHPSGFLGDNPVYEIDEGLICITPKPPTANVQESSNGDTCRSGSQPDREFANPIYDKCKREKENVYSVPELDTKIGMESTPCHKFNNPIYDNATDEPTYSMLSAANGAATEIENS